MMMMKDPLQSLPALVLVVVVVDWMIVVGLDQQQSLQVLIQFSEYLMMMMRRKDQQQIQHISDLNSEWKMMMMRFESE